MYYVNGMSGVISKHRKVEQAEKAYLKIMRQEQYPVIVLRKKEGNTIYRLVQDAEGRFSWKETEQFFATYTGGEDEVDFYDVDTLNAWQIQREDEANDYNRKFADSSRENFRTEHIRGYMKRGVTKKQAEKLFESTFGNNY